MSLHTYAIKAELKNGVTREFVQEAETAEKAKILFKKRMPRTKIVSVTKRD